MQQLVLLLSWSHLLCLSRGIGFSLTPPPTPVAGLQFNTCIPDDAISSKKCKWEYAWKQRWRWSFHLFTFPTICRQQCINYSGIRSSSRRVIALPLSQWHCLSRDKLTASWGTVTTASKARIKRISTTQNKGSVTRAMIAIL